MIGFRLRIYLCWWILSASTTVISWMMPAKIKSVWSVFFILSTTARQAKVFFDVIDIPFYYSSDFIGIVLVFCASDRARVCTVIIVLLNVNHSVTWWSGAWIFTITVPIVFTIFFVSKPFHFGTDKLVTEETVCFYPISFRLHRQRWIMGTAGDAVFIDGKVGIFKFRTFIERKGDNIWENKIYALTRNGIYAIWPKRKKWRIIWMNKNIFWLGIKSYFVIYILPLVSAVILRLIISSATIEFYYCSQILIMYIGIIFWTYHLKKKIK